MALLFAICAALLPAAALAANDTLTFCVEAADVRPYRTRNGEGLNFILLNRVAESQGFRFVYQPMSWPRCLAQLKAGAVDGAIAASYKADRTEYGAYPGGAIADPEKRLHTDRYVVLRRKGKGGDWDGKTFRDLEGRVGVQLGYSAIEQLQKLGVPIDDGAQSPDALMQKLAAGRVAMAAMLEGEARTLIARTPALADSIEILAAPLVEKPYYLLLSHPLLKSNPRQANAIWDGIEKVRKSPAYQKDERDALNGTAHK
jgi:polar amino acid transport system substrate-binding protein